MTAAAAFLERPARTVHAARATLTNLVKSPQGNRVMDRAPRKDGQGMEIEVETGAMPEHGTVVMPVGHSASKNRWWA